MADLDDFFKKRDKKKKPTAATTKSKFSVLDTEEFAKQLETITIKSAAELDPETNNVDGGVTETTAVNGNDEPAAFVAQTSQNENVDEEWKPFDSDENKDYSGLRINIQNWKVEDEENNYEETNEDNEKKAACPWGVANLRLKKTDDSEAADEETATPTVADSEEARETVAEPAVAAQTPSESATSEAPAKSAYVPPALRRQMEASGSASAAAAPAAAPAAPAASEPGKYIAPHLRNRGADSSSSGLTGGTTVVRKSNKAQPNIMDTMEFPTLDAGAPESAAAAAPVANGTSDRFEMAKKGGRVETKAGKGGSIDLDNKFTALSASNQ